MINIIAINFWSQKKHFRTKINYHQNLPFFTINHYDSHSGNILAQFPEYKTFAHKNCLLNKTNEIKHSMKNQNIGKNLNYISKNFD